MDQGKIIELQFRQNKILVWKPSDVRLLRETHHIVGSLTGALPRAPRQNIQLGLPLELMPEEANALISYGVGRIVRLHLPNRSQEDAAIFKEERRLSFQKQKAIYLEEARVKEKQFRDSDLSLVSKKKRKRAAKEKKLQQMTKNETGPSTHVDDSSTCQQDITDSRVNATPENAGNQQGTCLGDVAVKENGEIGLSAQESSLSIYHQQDTDLRADSKLDLRADSKLDTGNAGNRMETCLDDVAATKNGLQQITKGETGLSVWKSKVSTSQQNIDSRVYSKLNVDGDQEEVKLKGIEKKCLSSQSGIHGKNLAPGPKDVLKAAVDERGQLYSEINKNHVHDDISSENGKTHKAVGSLESSSEVKRSRCVDTARELHMNDTSHKACEKGNGFVRMLHASNPLPSSEQCSSPTPGGSKDSILIQGHHKSGRGEAELGSQDPVSSESHQPLDLTSHPDTKPPPRNRNVYSRTYGYQNSMEGGTGTMKPTSSSHETSGNPHTLDASAVTPDKDPTNDINMSSLTMPSGCGPGGNWSAKRNGADQDPNQKKEINVESEQSKTQTDQPSGHVENPSSHVLKTGVPCQTEDSEPVANRLKKSTSCEIGSNIPPDPPQSSDGYSVQHQQHLPASARSLEPSTMKRSRSSDQPPEEIDDPNFATDDGCRVQLFTEALDPVLSEVTDWTFPSTDKEKLRAAVFLHFWEQGYYLTSGMKFGGDFLVYKGDPLIFHSTFIAVCVPYDMAMSSRAIISYGRLGPIVKKTVVLCYLDAEDDVKCISLQWSGI